MLEQLPPSIDECYMVYPDQDSLHFIVALADPGDEGQAAFEAHFPRLKLALDFDQLADIQQVAMNVPMLTTGRHWFSKPQHWLMVAIQDEVPFAKFLVRAKDLSSALQRAVKEAPGCKFNIVGALEQFDAAGKALMDVVNGAAELPHLDLRSGGFE